MSLSHFDQFTALQHALSELNYSQPLLRDSVPLVQAIFSDLIEVTKKYTQVRSKSALSQKSLEAQLSAIKVENDKVTKSNNELHLKVIEGRDATQSDVRRFEKENEALKMARNELTVLLKQKKNKIKQQNVTVNNLKKKMNAVLSAKGATHKPSLLAHSQIHSQIQNNDRDSDSHSDDASIAHSHSHSNSDLKLLRDENAALLSKVQRLEGLADDAREERTAVDAKLRARDLELRRIHETLQIDDARIALIRHEQSKETSAQRIRHLQSQIEVLQNEMTAHERDVSADSAKTAALSKLKATNLELSAALESAESKTDALRRELIGVSRTADALKLEKAFDVTAGAKRITAAHSENVKGRQRTETLGARVKVLERKLAEKTKAHSILQQRANADSANKHALNGALETKERELLQIGEEQRSLRSICAELKRRIAALKSEMESNARDAQSVSRRASSSESALERSVVEKDALSDEVTALQRKLSQFEGAAVQSEETVSSLRSRVAAMGVDKSAMEQRAVASLERAGALEDADALKNTENLALAQRLESAQFENEDLKKARQWSDSATATLQRKLSASEQSKKAAQLKAERVCADLADSRTAKSALSTKLELAHSKLAELESKLAQSEERASNLSRVELELGRTQNGARTAELEMVRLRNALEETRAQHSMTAKSEARKSEMVRKLDGEKASLKMILQQMQQRMGAFQQRLQTLSADRDAKKANFDATMAEMDAKNAQIESDQQRMSDLKSEHQKVQSALTTAMRRFQQLQAEHSAAVSAVKARSSQMTGLEGARASLERDLHGEMADKKALHARLAALKKDNEAMANQILSLKRSHCEFAQLCETLKQSALVREAKMGELKVLCSKLDDAQKATRAQLETVHSEKRGVEHELGERRNAESESRMKIENTQKQNSKLKCALQKLVQKHDAVQNALDVRAEQRLAFDAALSSEHSKAEQMQSMLGEAQSALGARQKSLMATAQRANVAEAALHKLQSQIVPRLSEENRLKAAQLSAAQTDLQNMAKENEFVHAQSSETLKARDIAQKRLSSALNKVLVLEAQAKSASSERAQILTNFKGAAMDNQRLSELSAILERAKAESAVQIGVLQQHISRRDARLLALEKHLGAANLTNHELQRANQTLSRDLQRTELHRTKNVTQNTNLKKDLSALQISRTDVAAKQCADLEKKTGIIIAFKKENEKLQCVIRELSLEKEMALTSLEGAEGKMRSLEKCIEKLRVDGISKSEHSKARHGGSDEADKMKMELNQIKDLNDRLNNRLHTMQQ